MRDPGAPIELRLQAAQIAAPLCHGKLGAGDPGDSAKPVNAQPHGASNSAPPTNTGNKLSELATLSARLKTSYALKAYYAVAANRSHRPGSPLSSDDPRSENFSPAPATRSVTTLETQTSCG